ncbi:IS3 family transposase [Enterococcus faecalis]|uniref:IS3 family transposase n=1 Tax=Enterococcus faecalis TaxID=1351 RepID=UPI0040422D86
MEVAPSTYYKKLKQKPSSHDLDNEQIDQGILSIYTNSKKRYGVSKSHHQLIEQDFDFSIKCVQKRMRILNIHSITVKNIDQARLLKNAWKNE